MDPSFCTRRNSHKEQWARACLDPADVVHVTGSNGLVLTIAPRQQSTPRILGIVNAAAGQFSGRVTPGEVISIYGYGLGPTTPAIATPGASAFPTQLGGVQVLVNGVPFPCSTCPIRRSTPKSRRPSATWTTPWCASSTALRHFQDFRALRGCFYLRCVPESRWDGQSHQSGRPSSSNPAKAVTPLSIWVTGFLGNSGPTVDGHIATVARTTDAAIAKSPWKASTPPPRMGVHRPA
jgi:hypothetical protein